MANVMRVVSEEVYQRCMANAGQEKNAEQASSVKDFPLDVYGVSKERMIQSILMTKVFRNNPVTILRKSRLLLNALLDNRKFVWNEAGNFTYKGNLVPSSNIVFLIHALVISNPAFLYMRGSEEFARAVLEQKQVRRYLTKKMLSFLKNVWK